MLSFFGITLAREPKQCFFCSLRHLGGIWEAFGGSLGALWGTLWELGRPWGLQGHLGQKMHFELHYYRLLTKSQPLDICRDTKQLEQKMSTACIEFPAPCPPSYPMPVRTPLEGVRPSRQAHLQCPVQVHETCGYTGGVQHPVEWQATHTTGACPRRNHLFKKIITAQSNPTRLPLCGIQERAHIVRYRGSKFWPCHAAWGLTL